MNCPLETQSMLSRRDFSQVSIRIILAQWLLITCAFVIFSVLWDRQTALAEDDHKTLCKGRFVRLIAGYFIGPEELDDFLNDKEEVASCLNSIGQLANQSDKDVQLIKAYVISRSKKPSVDEIKQLYLQSCNSGSRAGCFYVASYSYGGIGRSIDEFISDHHQFLDEQLPVALVTVGAAKISGKGTARQDTDLGRSLLKGAMEKGDYWAPYFLAAASSNPSQVEENMQHAARLGNISAMLATGIRNINLGRANYGDAFAWFEKIANSDSATFTALVAEGQFWFATCYLYGFGTSADTEKARFWLKRSAALGNEDAERKLREFR